MLNENIKAILDELHEERRQLNAAIAYFERCARQESKPTQLPATQASFPWVEAPCRSTCAPVDFSWLKDTRVRCLTTKVEASEGGNGYRRALCGRALPPCTVKRDDGVTDHPDAEH